MAQNKDKTKVINPPIPYVADIPGGNLTIGKQIIIQGKLPPKSKGFGVNLALAYPIGPARADTAFHFNPRFNQKCVVRNTLKNNVWGDEERGDGMPFAQGNAFIMEIICKQRKYKVRINGSHFCDYRHRTPLADVNTITIEGDVVINTVQFIDPQPPPYNPSPMDFSTYH